MDFYTNERGEGETLINKQHLTSTDPAKTWMLWHRCTCSLGLCPLSSPAAVSAAAGSSRPRSCAPPPRCGCWCPATAARRCRCCSPRCAHGRSRCLRTRTRKREEPGRWCWSSSPSAAPPWSGSGSPPPPEPGTTINKVRMRTNTRFITICRHVAAQTFWKVMMSYFSGIAGSSVEFRFRKLWKWHKNINISTLISIFTLDKVSASLIWSGSNKQIFTGICFCTDVSDETHGKVNWRWF